MYSVRERRGAQLASGLLAGTGSLSSAVERAQSIMRSQHVRLEFLVFQVARAVQPETVRFSSAVDRAQSILRSQHERLESHVVPGVTCLRPSHSVRALPSTRK